MPGYAFGTAAVSRVRSLTVRRRERCALSRLGAWLAALLCLAPVGAGAADTGPGLLDESEYLADLPVVLSATRLSQHQSETPAAITVVDREMIKASGARQIADLFRFVPGFQVGYLYGHQPSVTYHGLADEFSRRMQVLVDGRSVYSPMFGGVFWAELPLAIDDIERIEVIRGPNAATYGANAVLGVINIITRHPSQDPGTYARVASGNQGIRDGTVRHGWSGANHDVRATFGYRADDGFRDRIDSSRVPFASLRAEIQRGARDSIELQAGASAAVAEKGIETSLTNIGRETDTLTNYQFLRWARQLDTDEELVIQFYHNYRKHEDDFLTRPLPFLANQQVPIDFNSTEQRYDIELQHILRLAPDWRLVWGAGLREDQVRAPGRLGTTATLENRQERLFANIEWRASGRTVVNAGAMIERTDFIDTEVSPRLAVNYHLAAGHTVRLAASRAARNPVFLETSGNESYVLNGLLLEQQSVPAPDLGAEKLQTYELGYLGQWLDRRVLFDVRVYRDRLKNMITEIFVPAPAELAVEKQAFSFENIGEVVVDGVDARLDWRVTPATRLALTYAYADASGTDIAAPAVRNQQRRLESVPEETMSALLMHRLSPEWEAGVGYYRVGDMLWMGNGDELDGYARLDLRLARRLRLGGSDGELALVVQNALDDEYQDFIEENIADRRVFATLVLELP